MEDYRNASVGSPSARDGGLTKELQFAAGTFGMSHG